jgi:hypothetical protein
MAILTYKKKPGRASAKPTGHFFLGSIKGTVNLKERPATLTRGNDLLQ